MQHSCAGQPYCDCRRINDLSDELEGGLGQAMDGMDALAEALASGEQAGIDAGWDIIEDGFMYASEVYEQLRCIAEGREPRSAYDENERFRITQFEDEQ